MTTPTHLLRQAGCAALLCASLGPALADDFSFSGQIAFHNDLVQIAFSLIEPSNNVRIWTDSWTSGLNFDPAAALWQRIGADSSYSLLSQVDDDDTIDPGQGFYDTGFMLSSLSAGQYRVTLVAAFNAASGMQLSQGFAWDAEAPILLEQWNQPSYDPNANDQKRGFWRVNLSQVSQASVVPEPGAWLLMALGLAAVAPLVARRRTATERITRGTT